MSDTTYKIAAGDTAEKIARRIYGSEQFADSISRANPGLVEPFIEGVEITTPLLPEAPKDAPHRIEASNKDETALTIGSRFRFWENIRIVRSFDAMDVVEFSAPFDSELPEFRETFRPATFKTMDVTVGGETLFTGTVVSIDPVLEDSQSTVAVSGYSTPGILNDCHPPASDFPIEFNVAGLQDIAVSMAKPFGVGVVFGADQGDIFERAEAKPDERVLSFLIKLAKQRGLVVSNTPDGELLFQKAVSSGSPVAILEQGSSPLMSVTPLFSMQDVFSHITGIRQTVIGDEGSQFTVANSRLKGVVRPLNFDIPDTEEGSVEVAVRAKLGRMYANTVSYAVRVDTWRDPSDQLWKPNTTIKLQANEAMIYKSFEFLIRKVELVQDPKTQTAMLDLVIPGSYNDEDIEVLPWDD